MTRLRRPFGLVGPDLLGHGVAVGGGQHDLRGGLPAVPGGCLQGYQPSGQELLGDGQAGAHPQPGLVVAAERGQARVEFAGDRQQPGGPLRHHDALRGQGGPARRPGDQRDAGLRFGRPDPGGHRLLGDAELPGGRVQAASMRDREQHLQGGQVGYPVTERHPFTLTPGHNRHL
jgi:hypothetical protein